MLVTPLGIVKEYVPGDSAITSPDVSGGGDKEAVTYGFDKE
jgi:hypothetical protein